jgi:hypothetical protein
MQLIAQKIESWIALALATVAAEKRLPIYQGQDFDGNRKRPAIAVICDGADVTPGFLWEDNERTGLLSVYLSSPADNGTDGHTNRCAALEAALQDQATVAAFAASVADFYLYRYSITGVAHSTDDASRSRTARYTISVICRDDSGTP